MIRCRRPDSDDVTVSVAEDPAVGVGRPLADTGDAINVDTGRDQRRHRTRSTSTPDAVKAVASAGTMEEAVELANRDVVRLLAHGHGFAETEASPF